ncbi:MAG: hypothetical protein ABI276_04515 [Acidimicrobiales bacterium]
MLFALAPTSFGYRLLFLLHIFLIVVAFAPAFVWPLMGRQRRQTGGAPGAATASTTPAPTVIGRVLSPAVHGVSLVLAGLVGLLIVVLSKTGGVTVFKMSQPWVSIALLLWFLMMAVLFVGLVPTEKKLAAGEEPPERRAALDQRLSMLYGALHLLFLLQLIDMIWKPGLLG